MEPAEEQADAVTEQAYEDISAKEKSAPDAKPENCPRKETSAEVSEKVRDVGSTD